MSYFSANYSYQYAVQILSFFWYLFSWTTDIYVWEEKKKKSCFTREEKSESGYPGRSKQMKSTYC